MALKLHPEYLVKDGKKQLVVLPYEEFESLQELLADAQDLLDLREAMEAEGEEPGVPIENVKKQLGLA